MSSKELFENLGDYKIISGIEPFEVTGISCDSRGVSQGCIFVAIKGVARDGNQFIQEALDRGARAVVMEAPLPGTFKIPKGIQVIVVGDARKAAARLAADFYGRPAEKLKVIGITGTNGKTTVSYLIEALLREAGKNPAVIGTVNYRFNSKCLVSSNTTPGPLELQKLFKTMLEENVDYVAMEVSSHALEQDRTETIKFRSAIFTNLTQDHLDYHNNMDDYFSAKARLFANLPVDAHAIINSDDTYAIKLLPLIKSAVLSFAIEKKADVSATDIRFGSSGSEFILKTKKYKEKFKTPLIGRHNIYNILASVAFGITEGFDLSLVKKTIAKFGCVPGRLERIDTGKDFLCFVDYAHTDDALCNVIKALREISTRRIIVVFGCGGERDKTKRPKMGRVVTEMADFAFITNDNPRSEEPDEIISQIKIGIKKDNYRIIPDRAEAIKEALSYASCGDIVLIAGKGHENYQILKDVTVHFDDREAVRQCLN